MSNEMQQMVYDRNLALITAFFEQLGVTTTATGDGGIVVTYDGATIAKHSRQEIVDNFPSTTGSDE